MTSAQPADNHEERIRRLEDLMISLGALTQEVSRLAQRNSSDLDQLTERVNSLAAGSERQERILDYLLRREAGDIDPE